MRLRYEKSYAILMIVTTAIGILFSLFFLVQTWRYRSPATEKLQSFVTQTTAVLDTTEQGLDIIDQVVKNVYTSTIFLDTSANELADTVQSTNQFIDLAGTFMGESLINTITNTQTAIDSAQASAVVIDNILTTLSRIPLIGIDYNPTRPLNETLGDVSESLDPLQSSLQGFQSSLQTTQTSMQQFETQITILDQNVIAINESLQSTQLVIRDYRRQLSSLQSWMDETHSSLPGWINTLVAILTLFFIWLLLIQVGLLLQAIQILRMPEIETGLPGNG